jgi:hypothetical protein
VGHPAIRSNATRSAISCFSAKACTAAGDEEAGRTGRDVTVAMRWDGTGWSRQHTPNPAGAGGSSFAAVSCTSATACTAAGSWNPSHGRVQFTLAERWNGRAWAVTPTRNPAGPAFSSLSGLSCVSARVCTAVGSSIGRRVQVSVTLAEGWNGTRWATERTANKAEVVYTTLAGVSCLSASACIAVGTAAGTPLSEVWNGTAWAIRLPPRTGGALSGVSCMSATACVAVGTSLGKALAERWNGTRWAVLPARTPSTAATSTLAGVSCVSASACMAVGKFINHANRTSALAERWNGTGWTRLRVPRPPAPAPSSLSAVSCTSARACVAAGTAAARASADRWNGTTWASAGALTPPDADSSSLAGVSCTSATACTAVGGYHVGGGPPGNRTLAERWDGTSWLIQPTPNPSPAVGGPSLASVSCASATACTAIGRHAPTSFTLALAEAWEGTAWSLQPIPSPGGEGGGSALLTGISCVSATDCTAVGYSVPDTLAERYS